LGDIDDRTPMNILITGFGPFPGAPFNPTGRLAEKLAQNRRLASGGLRYSAHVFRTSYDAIDHELPDLLARLKPDVVLMFGLASRTRHVRVETRARNTISGTLPDAAGRKPQSARIAAGAAASLPLRAPTHRLVRAARAAGVVAAPSHNAGRYLCNYLCWRAAEASARPDGPRLVAFVHVPKVRIVGGPRVPALSFERLMRAAEAIVREVVAAARTAR
jgi:pyroglutamyl-peptidase